MKKLLFISSLVLSAFWSCTKGDLPKVNEPIFNLAGTINDTIFNWEAGVDNKYMLAGTDSTALARLYSGNLGQISSPYSNGFPSIEIIFVKNNADSGDINSILKTGTFQYATSANSLINYALTYFSQNSIGLQPLKYTFNFANFNSKLPAESFSLPNPDVQGIASLEIRNAADSVSKQTMYVDLLNNRIIKLQISVTPNKMLVADVLGDSPQSIVWSTGDSAQTIGIDSVIRNYSVMATLSNNQIISSSVILNASDQPILQAELNLDFQTFADSLPLSNFENQHVIVRFADENGQLFSSEWGVQNANDFFNVNAIDDFDRNEAGVKTKKMDINFSCHLKNSPLNQEIVLKNVVGKIAVGVPD
jgi:hypothetical protein